MTRILRVRLPWLPELFSAPALERLREKQRRDDLRNLPYFDGMLFGELDALIES